MLRNFLAIVLIMIHLYRIPIHAQIDSSGNMLPQNEEKQVCVCVRANFVQWQLFGTSACTPIYKLFLLKLLSKILHFC